VRNLLNIWSALCGGHYSASYRRRRVEPPVDHWQDLRQGVPRFSRGPIENHTSSSQVAGTGRFPCFSQALVLARRPTRSSLALYTVVVCRKVSRWCLPSISSAHFSAPALLDPDLRLVLAVLPATLTACKFHRRVRGPSRRIPTTTSPSFVPTTLHRIVSRTRQMGEIVGAPNPQFPCSLFALSYHLSLGMFLSIRTLRRTFCLLLSMWAGLHYVVAIINFSRTLSTNARSWMYGT